MSKTRYWHRREDRRLLERKQELVRHIKDVTPCISCQARQSYHTMLTFHHVDPTSKILDIGSMVYDRRFGYEELWREIQKCQLLCQACHWSIHRNNPTVFQESRETRCHE